MDNKKRYPIGYVATRCGLTPHVIRAWEKRYGAVEPSRTATNRRLYSDTDIERLRLLKQITDAGNSISQVAGLNGEALYEAARREQLAPSDPGLADSKIKSDVDPQSHYSACLDAVINLDSRALDLALSKAAIALPEISLIENVLAPLTQKVGEMWSDGSLKIFGEHMAMSVIRSFLGDLLRSAQIPPQAPRMVVSTPVGQLHEFGALIVSAVAMTMGWSPTYLGPNLPAEEISAAVDQTAARLVALSIVHPVDDPRVDRELQKLSRYLNVPLIVGGRAAKAYEHTLKKIKAVVIYDIGDLSRTLSSILSG